MFIIFDSRLKGFSGFRFPRRGVGYFFTYFSMRICTRDVPSFIIIHIYIYIVYYYGRSRLLRRSSVYRYDIPLARIDSRNVRKSYSVIDGFLYSVRRRNRFRMGCRRNGEKKNDVESFTEAPHHEIPFEHTIWS